MTILFVGIVSGAILHIVGRENSIQVLMIQPLNAFSHPVGANLFSFISFFGLCIHVFIYVEKLLKRDPFDRNQNDRMWAKPSMQLNDPKRSSF